MPFCPNCQQNIADKGWNIHSRMCNAKSTAPATVVKIEPLRVEVAAIPEVKPISTGTANSG